jgi:DNA-binding MarR family transcriptional regulator
MHAHRQSGLSMSAIARDLGISPARASQLVAKAEARRGSDQ